MTDGFFQLRRRFFDHWLWNESRELSRAEAFLDLLQLAAFAPTRRLVAGRSITVPKGGIVASERFLSERWKWSRTKVRHFQGMLEADHMIRLEKDQENAVIILCNYSRWNPEKDHLRTSGEPAGNQMKEGEEGKELKPEREPREIPSWPIVKNYAESIGLSEWKAKDWFEEMEGCGWLDFQKRYIHKWQPVLNRVKTKWESDGRPTKPHGTHQKQLGGNHSKHDALHKQKDAKYGW